MNIISERKALLMRFSDFLDEAPPPAPAPLAPPTTVAPAHQHVLGPPPHPGDVSAFAELFGAVHPDAAAFATPPAAPLVQHDVPQAAVDLQAAVEALVVPRDIVEQSAPTATPAPAVIETRGGAEPASVEAITATARALEGPLIDDVAVCEPAMSSHREMTIDDDLLPQRSSRVAKSQETRAWSRGRSKR